MAIAPPSSPPSAESRQGGATGQTTISIRGLTKSFTKRGSRESGPQALADVDLDVRTSEFLVLLGPSGCGKTTLLRSIAGLETPDRGSITIDGGAVFDSEAGLDIEPRSRPVSMIFQSYALWPHMTAGKNVAFPLECHRVGKREIPDRVKDILDRVGIGHLIDRYPGEMSGGQQQRLALARALVIGQRIVLFDEPLSNVDAQVRERLRLELLRMQRTIGFTAIYVTHDQSEAMELADRVAVMDHGRVAQLGEPREMYRRPRDIHVARFLGQSNEIQVTVERADVDSHHVVGSGPIGPVTASWQANSWTGDPPTPGEHLIAFSRLGDVVVRNAGADAASGAPADGMNRWSGTVEAVRFMGTHTQYQVKIGQIRLRAWATSDGQPELDEGSPVVVTINPRDLRVMREPSA